MTDSPPLPRFLIIGAQKSATRWLRSNLGKHPDVFAAPEELSFFNTRYRQGPDYYRAQFEGWDGEPIVGEATPGYMMWRHKPPRIARRIHETIPDVRLIAVLRDPIERANSAMHHHIRRDRIKKRSKLVDVATRMDPTEDRMCIVTGGWYAASLDTYFELFGDQLLVVLHDDVIEDPSWVYATALEHIGAEPGFEPPDLAEVVFSNQKGADGSSTPTPRRSVSDEDRLALWPYFKDDVEKLERMIRRDLSEWDPTDDRFRWPQPPADLTEYHVRAMAWVEDIIRGVQPEQHDDATPCPAWNVRELLAHMVNLMRLNATAFRPDSTLVPYTDTVAEDPGDAFADAAADLLVALEEAERQRLAILVPVGVMPPDVQLALNLKNQIAHGWDLAVATGQDATIPDEIAEPIERFSRELFAAAPMLRGAFGDEVPVSPTSPAGDRFVAVLGRDPSLARSSVRPR